MLLGFNYIKNEKDGFYMDLSGTYKKSILLLLLLIVGAQLGAAVQSRAYSSGPDALGVWTPADSLDSVVDVSVYGSYAYLAVNGAGIQILDIANPLNPQPEGNYTINRILKSIHYENEKIYLGVGNPSAILIFNVTTPTSLVFDKEIGQNSTVYQVDVDGDYIVIADYSGSLMIANYTQNLYNVNDWWVANNYWCLGVVVDGDFAYTATFAKGLVVWNLTDKTHPTIVAERPLGVNLYSVAFDGESKVILGGSAGFLALFDVSDPTVPTLLGDIDTDGGDLDALVITGSAAIGADYSYGIVTLSIAMSIPVEHTRLPPTERGHGVDVDATYIYGAMGFSGLYIWDLAAAIEGMEWEIPGFTLLLALIIIVTITLVLKQKTLKFSIN